MSKMKSNLAATLLTLVFAVPGLAGNIGSPGSSPPPPPPPTTSVATPGDMDSQLLNSPELVDILLSMLWLL